MTIATVEVRDERVRGGAEHLHKIFETMAEARDWIDRLENALGDLRATIEEWLGVTWYCVSCGYRYR